MKIDQKSEIETRISSLPKKSLVSLPTPIMKMEALSHAFGGPEIYFKRDDLTGLGFGGNKSRKLESIIGDALAKKCDTIITWGSAQSNWCLQTAAAARKFGIRPLLVLFNKTGSPPPQDGNLFLDLVLEADIRIMEDPGNGEYVPTGIYLKIIETIAEEERLKGAKPYVVTVGGSLPAGGMTLPLGAISYVEAFAEMSKQTAAMGFRPDAVVHATGSGGTQAGLIVGARAFLPGTQVVGISVSRPKEILAADLKIITAATEKFLGLNPPSETGDIIVFDDYVKEGYGIISREVTEIIRCVFKTEGVVLDPVYTAKGMVGFHDLIAKAYFRKSDKIVFFHTGGTPALFASKTEILGFL
jgi:D-cysteine desulfhydrase family pyridoxal phosphate-dependent enzyme